MSIVSSILTGGVNNHATTNEEANALSTDFVSPGVVGTVSNTSGVAPATGGYAVNATGTPDTNVQISAGTAYVTATPSTQGSQTIRLKNSATITQAISANSSGSTKYDWVYLSVDATNANAPNTAGDNVGSITVSRSSSAATDDGTPPTYAILLAVVTVANGFSTITNSVIRDRRTQTTIGATSASPDTFWTTGGLPAVSSVTENGNRSADITFASTVASILTPGMRLRTSRTVAAPTQCADLESSSSQYFSDSSVSGMTFTDDFTAMAWVKPESYAAMTIIGRLDATPSNGWRLWLNSTGQINIQGYNSGGANIRYWTSYQSVPLSKWSHVAATLDMSGFTSATCKVYIDGIEVPGFGTSGGTNPTSLVQAGDLAVGRPGSYTGGEYFDGKIAQVAVFNSILSASNILYYKNQTLSGSETNLVSAYSFNNTLNDLNTGSANNLTANGGALATNADSPFTVDANGTPGGTYDWAIVTKVATTVATVQYPEGCAIPTSGGISTVDYSGVASPFGMPVSRGRWVVEMVYIGVTGGATSAATSYNRGVQLTVPVGDFTLAYLGVLYGTDTAGTSGQVSTNLSLTSANLTPVTGKLTSNSYSIATGASTTGFVQKIYAEDSVSMSAATIVYGNIYTENALDDARWMIPLGQVGGRGLTIYAIPDHL